MQVAGSGGDGEQTPLVPAGWRAAFPAASRMYARVSKYKEDGL